MLIHPRLVHSPTCLQSVQLPGDSPGTAVTIQLLALAVQMLRPIPLGVLKHRHVQSGAPVHGHTAPLKITAYTSHTQWPISLAMKTDYCV